MVRPMPMIHVNNESFCLIPIAIGLFASATLVVGLCAKHVSRKQASKTKDPTNKPIKQFITTISHKGIMVKSSEQEADHGHGDKEENGVWQKAILMGERCQPPEFSGVIYYDYCGNRISEMPKSPRATSMSPLRSFNFPLDKNEH
ncbi:hypothetical protein CASFOL_024295 [Castilleja foliolosa]|uniref:Uncharacterized protein n=1 Tax=Castilleja foliolosa TaxID=1961234 RepID=A0ABD3CMX0_9LAMI